MQIKVDVVIPDVPNYIYVGKENRDIREFTDEQLLVIAKEWTNKLLAHAERKRKEPVVLTRKGWDGVLREDK